MEKPLYVANGSGFVYGDAGIGRYMDTAWALGELVDTMRRNPREIRFGHGWATLDLPSNRFDFDARVIYNASRHNPRCKDMLDGTSFSAGADGAGDDNRVFSIRESILDEDIREMCRR